ncbi:hypothetical protein TEK04_10555 [Klenkia sp. LSe6-5]|uniref:Nitroreductase family protein n=1 Tax=Klenkia sesuvii TaxID=3103137 RepID=A0ABU8DVU3_9ACTN
MRQRDEHRPEGAGEQAPVLTRAGLLQALGAAQRAPSVHNTQPWRWRLAPDQVRLIADRSRSLPATDPTGRELRISCGAVLHHLVTVLRAVGQAAVVQRFPDPADPWLLAALHMSPTAPGPDDLALAAAVPTRRTDRRPYADWPVPQGWWHVLTTTAAVHGAQLLAVEPDARWAVGQLAEAAAAQLASVPGVAAETRAWSGRPTGTSDGVPAALVPTGPDSASVPRRSFAAAQLPQPVGPLPEGDGALLAVLATDVDDEVHQLRAGEALSAILLHATAAGFASHTISEVVEVSETRRRLAEEVSAGHLAPQVLLRIGWSPAGNARLPATGRRAVTDTVDPGELPC